MVFGDLYGVVSDKLPKKLAFLYPDVQPTHAACSREAISVRWEGLDDAPGPNQT